MITFQGYGLRIGCLGCMVFACDHFLGLRSRWPNSLECTT